MSEVKQVSPSELNPASWRATYMLSPDLAVLARSIHKHGILSPIIVRKDGMTIVDGHERHSLALNNPQIRESVGEVVPVSIIDCTEQEAMILHIQMNRGRGSIVAKKLSHIIRTLSKTGKLDEEGFVSKFCMKFHELELMLDGTLLIHRDIKNHTYSRAWVPIEAPSGTIDKEPLVIEQPPNLDR